MVDSDEILRMEWRALDALPEPLVPDVEAALEDLTAGRSGVVRTVQRKLTLPPLSLPDA